ncbi:hypothetical protein DM02DRAFT_234885 [Periconia macrospinosa]|uniref:Uncharacterized protein n=1 Tax=Periconia macrospinosa TaxID=97972 RepID=A0A2V1EB99_9PLEO|nr:hypothetical protein DM02DRAFT_234885 [Periconia macrospinosa]
MRLTRAALRAEAQQPDIETFDASKPPANPQAIEDRVPLSDVSGNTSIELDPEEADQVQSQRMPPKKSKAKAGAKKGAKGKKGKAVKDDNTPVVESVQDEPLAAGDPAADAAVGELAEPTPETERPASPPPTRSLRMTRRQLAIQEEEFSRSLRSRPSPTNDDPAVDLEDTVAGSQQESNAAEPEEEVVAQSIEEATPAEEGHAEIAEEAKEEPVINVQEEVQELKVEPPTAAGEESHESEIIPSTPNDTTSTPTVEIFAEPEPKTLTSEKPCEEEATPAASRTPSRPSSRSPSKSPMRLEESIEAFDALEEALENVGKAIPLFDQSADEAPQKKALPKTSTPKKKSPAVARVSRNPNVAPKSLKSTTSKPLPRSSLGRASSVRTASSSSAKNPAVRKPSGEPVDYLASKRRPISMSFPTPPPPPKSQRAPTKATFELPGEAVAAKLKAQKEERLKREAEAGSAKKPRPISMPPPPKSTKPPTKPNFQLPGEAIAAKLKAQKEERLKREAEGGNQQSSTTSSRPISLPPPPKSTKPPTKPNFTLPGEAVAAKLKAQREERLKREEQEAAEAAKKVPFKARPAPTARPSTTTLNRTSSLTVPKRSGSVTTNTTTTTTKSRTASSSSSTITNSNRNSVVFGGGHAQKSTVTPADAALLKLKGRQVFNRDKVEKETRERERREKEEAAKKARAEAAERGRIASREWAERQKRKLLGVVGAAGGSGESKTT